MSYSQSGVQILDTNKRIAALAINTTAAATIVGILNAAGTPAPTPIPTPVPPTPTPVTSWMSGGYGGAANTGAIHDFETAIGHRTSLVHDYLDERNWGTINDPSWWLNTWRADGRTNLMLGVPLTCDGTPLSDVAAGKYDSQFQNCATAIAKAGFSTVIIRLAWEYNGDWYPWAAKKDTSSFISAWRRVVGIFRSCGKFIIDLGISGQSGNPQGYYPGDDFVDGVSIDAYDMKWGGASSFSDRWSSIANNNDGLGFIASFAKQHSKMIGVPEWGCSAPSADNNGGGGDDPQYVQAMHDWMVSVKVNYEAWFPVNGAAGFSAFPNAAAKYKQLWSA